MSNFIQNIASFYKPIEMPGYYNFDHADTIKTIDLYYNSKFKSGNVDRSGFRKYFFNIIKPACDIATKFVDLDVSNIILKSTKPNQDFILWAMIRDLKQWLKNEQFGIILNEIGFDYPKYASVVVKKYGGNKIKKVNIQNLRMDTTTDLLENSPFVYEILEMTLKDMTDQKWDTEGLPENQSIFTVYQTHEQNAVGKWDRKFLADPFRKKEGDGTIRAKEAEINTKEEYLPPFVLKEDEVSELPYRELHWEKVPGRWLGFGFAEYLIENQIADNEAENLERKALYLKALQLYQTKDQRIGRNVLVDMESGDILKTTAEVIPVAKDNSDLAAFNTTRNRWKNNSAEKTFSFDISRGGELPSRTPLGVANLSAAMVSSYFELKRENFGLFVKELLFKDIIPNFKNKSQKEHTLIFMGSDPEIDKYDRAIAESAVLKGTIEFAGKNGFMPPISERDSIKERIVRELKDLSSRSAKIIQGLYDKVKYLIDIEITGEGFGTINPQNLQVALTLMGQNPALLQNVVTRTILFKFLEGGKMSPVDLNMLAGVAETSPQPVAPQGGSVARPTTPTTTPTKQPVTV